MARTNDGSLCRSAILTSSTLALWLSGCLVDDPNHCANRQGDATCSEIGGGSFCSLCQGENNGCVAEQPPAACHAPVMEVDESTGSSTGDAATSSTGGSEETGEPTECMTEGLDPSCPEESPYCIDGTCSGCDAGAETLCESVDGTTPLCHADWGQCVQCMQDSDCGAGQFCDNSYACGGCTRHAQCPDSACNIAAGECFSPNAVYWIDPLSPCPGFGTEGEPYCETASGLTAMDDGGSGVLKLVARGYEQILDVKGSRTVAAISVGTGRANFRQMEDAIRVTVDSTLYLQGVQVRDNTGDGIECSFGARLWLDDVLVFQNATGVLGASGVVGDGCKRMVIRQSQIYDNDGDGISLTNSKLQMESSAVFRNGVSNDHTRGLRSVKSEIDISYSTFADNQASDDFNDDVAPKNIFCTGGLLNNGDITIRNSVVVAPLLESIDCPWATASNSVIDSFDLMMGEGQVIIDQYQAGWFEDIVGNDVHVPNPESSPFADVAVWQLGDPRSDLDGTRRTPAPGALEFAGADQP